MIRIVLAVTCGLLAGCATYATMMVNDDMKIVRCGTSGQGAIGIARASSSHDECVKNLRSAGFMTIDEAGTTGISRVDMVEKSVRISVIKAGSPAAAAGIAAGDFIVSVDNLPVVSAGEAMRRLFGRAGTTVTFVTRKGATETPVTLARASYSSVYGTAQ